MTKKERMQMYYRIYEMVECALRAADACQWKAGKCNYMRERAKKIDRWAVWQSERACCERCRDGWTPEGCKIKALGCKLYLCHVEKERLPKLWGYIVAMMEVATMLKIPTPCWVEPGEHEWKSTRVYFR